MSILTMHNLSQSFGAFDLFSGISGSIPNDGKIGLVGPNGVGKTTLIHILTGQETAKTGSVTLARDVRLGYLQQEAMRAFAGRESAAVYDEMLAIFAPVRQQAAELQAMEQAMADGTADEGVLEEYGRLLEAFEHAGGYDYETRIRQVLDGLGFDRANWHTPLQHLSGGQKTRALLAKLLLEKPDILVLDEPTNHLDVEAIEWLENTLRAWHGALLIVSHDRYFLDRVANTIWEMSATDMEVYKGNYSAYVNQRQERWERREKEYVALKERLEKEMEFIKRNISGQNTNIAQGKLNRLSRELKAIEVGGLALVLSGKQWSQMGVGSQRPMAVAEAEERVKSLPRPQYRPHVPSLRLTPSHRSGNIVLRTQELVIGYPAHPPLFVAADIELWRLENAALIGPNGAGKTTFLRTVLGQLDPVRGKVELGASLNVAYFSQAHESLNHQNSILDELMRHHNMLISEARDYLGQYLFRGDDVYKKVGMLSGGERGRLALAILALQEANFLLLDEPTNHLDISSQELLEEVLNRFDGTILLVSHDRYLIDKLATQIWAVQDGRLQVFQGTYSEFAAARDGVQVVQKTAAPPPLIKEETAAPTLSKNELQRRARALETIEKEIAALEKQVAATAEAMQQASEAQDFGAIQAKSIEYAALEAELNTLIHEWEKMVSE